MSIRRLFSAPVFFTMTFAMIVSAINAPATLAQAPQPMVADALATIESTVLSSDMSSSETTTSSPVYRAISYLLPRQWLGVITAASYCQCVTYANNRNIAQRKYSNRIYADAADWGAPLRARGFTESRIPLIGDVAVFPRNILPGDGGRYGHVGFVTAATYYGDGAAVSLAGANQATSGWRTDYDCYNVSTNRYAKQPWNKVMFYRK